MKDLGQFFITGVGGTSLSPEEKEFLEMEKIGGVILFSKNFKDPDQLKKLVDSIQSLKKDYPFFISVDHEGGRVIRFRQFFTQVPPMLKLAALNEPDVFFKVAKIMGDELNSCGINLNFTPCCDLFTNPKNAVIGDRAFGDDPKKVAPLIEKFIEGLKKGKVLSCAKHFPGHGDTLEDSHFALPRVSNPQTLLKEREYLPFVSAIKSGVDTIMMGHLLVDEIDPNLPCSLSKKAYDILRNDLKFDGLIITDDMQMDAIKKGFTLEQGVELSILAGANCLIYRDLNYTQKALKALKASKIPKEKIKESLGKIIDFKKAKLSQIGSGKISFLSGEKLMGELKNKLAEH